MNRGDGPAGPDGSSGFAVPAGRGGGRGGGGGGLPHHQYAPVPSSSPWAGDFQSHPSGAEGQHAPHAASPSPSSSAVTAEAEAARQKWNEMLDLERAARQKRQFEDAAEGQGVQGGNGVEYAGGNTREDGELLEDRLSGANKRLRKMCLYRASHKLRTDIRVPPANPAASHIVIPDATALLGHFQEIFELPNIKDIVILQSVWTILRQRSGARSFARLKAIVEDKRRRCSYFANEHHADCFVHRTPYEHRKMLGRAFAGKMDENGIMLPHYESVCRAAAWLSTFAFGGKQVVVLTESDRCMDIASSQGLGALSWPNYLAAFHPESPELSTLYESLAAAAVEYRTYGGGGDSGGVEGAAGEESGMTESSMEEGIKQGKLLKGTLKVSKRNAANAFVKPEGSTRRFLVETGEKSKALPEDKVVIQLLSESEWKSPSSALADEGPEGGGGVVGGGGEGVPTARIVGVLERTDRMLVATLQDDSSLNLERGNTENILAIPIDQRFPKIRIRTRMAQQLLGNRIVLRIDGWEATSRYPHGHYVRDLGPIGDLQTETQAILVENGISVCPFTEAARSELPPLPPGHAERGSRAPWKVPDSEASRRRDLRETHRVFSIDPPGCQDIDDAMSARPLPGGGYEVGVHIADVGHFVRPGSLLDAEARARGTTVYLTDRRFNMIPEALSENLCSLREGVDRLAMSCIWEMDAEGRIQSSWFGPTVIRSCNEFAYSQAQAIHDGDMSVLGKGKEGHCEEVQKDMLILMRLATAIRARRKEAGGLDLESAELQFLLDDQHQPTEIMGKEEQDVHWMVAEWMIAANSSVAKRIYDSFPTRAILRNHGTPDPERMDGVAKLARLRGIDFDFSSNKAVADSLKEAEEKGGGGAGSGKAFVLLLKMLTTRGMREALYVCTGQADPNALYHYGLALEYYTHFTSPIRRYADLLVHRVLMAAISKDEEEEAKMLNALMLERGMEEQQALGATSASMQSEDDMGVLGEVELSEVCEHINERNRASKRAQSQCTELFLSLYFKDKVEVADAIVFDVRANGLLVLLPKYKIKEVMMLKTASGADLLVPKRLLQGGGGGCGDGMDDSGGSYSLEEDKEGRRLIVRGPGGKEVMSFNALDRIKVELQGQISTHRLPRLRVTLADISSSSSSALSSSSPSLAQHRGGGSTGGGVGGGNVSRQELMSAVRDRQAASSSASSSTRLEVEEDAAYHLKAEASEAAGGGDRGAYGEAEGKRGKNAALVSNARSCDLLTRGGGAKSWRFGEQVGAQKQAEGGSALSTPKGKSMVERRWLGVRVNDD